MITEELFYKVEEKMREAIVLSMHNVYGKVSPNELCAIVMQSAYDVVMAMCAWNIDGDGKEQPSKKAREESPKMALDMMEKFVQSHRIVSGMTDEAIKEKLNKEND